MAEKQAVIITHNDLDGVAAASVIYRILKLKKRKVKLLFSQPHSLDKILLMASKPISPDEIYIVDIAFDEGCEQKLLTLFKELIKQNIKIVWIDHHPSTIKYAHKLKETGIEVHVAYTLSVAPIVRKIFFKKIDDPEFYEKVLMLGEAGDRARTLRKNRALSEIYESVSFALEEDPINFELRQHLTRLWGEKKQLIDDVIALKAEKGRKRYEEIVSIAREHVIVDTPRLKILDMTEKTMKGFSGRLAVEIVEKENKVVAVMLRSGYDEMVIVLRVPKSQKLDAGELARELGFQLNGSGGGHPKAAAVRLPISKKMDAVKILLQKIG